MGISDEFVKFDVCGKAYDEHNSYGEMPVVGKKYDESHRKIGAGNAIAGQAMLTVWLIRIRTPRTLNSSATLIFGAIFPIGSVK